MSTSLLKQAIDLSATTECPIHIDDWQSVESVLACIPDEYEVEYFDVSDRYKLGPDFRAICFQGCQSLGVPWEVVAYIPMEETT